MKSFLRIALFTFLALLGSSAKAQTNTFCPVNLNCTITGNWQFTGTLSTSNIDTFIYVDGHTYAQSGAGIQAAINALPSCSIANPFYNSYLSAQTWTHCGTVILPSANYTVSSTINIYSPMVRLWGSDGGSTVLTCNQSSGACIYWTGVPGIPGTNYTYGSCGTYPTYFGNEFNGTDNLENVRLDGRGSSAGTFGLETEDFSGFHSHGVTIQNFAGTGSIGWNDYATCWYNEKDIVEMSLANNKINWSVNAATTSPGYPTTTFGYGTFDIHAEDWSGQVGLRVTNGSLSNSIIHATFNQPATPANADAIDIFNSSVMLNNVYSIEIESPGGIGTGNELNFTSSAAAPFAGVGSIVQGAPLSNTTSGSWSGGVHYFPVGWQQYWPQFQTADNNAIGSGTPNVIFRINPCPIGNLVGCNIIDVNATPLSTYQTNTWPQATGAMPVVPSLPTVGQCAIWIATASLYELGSTPCGNVFSASLTTTAATSDAATVTGATSSSHCSLAAKNASAATNITTSYISATASNSVTVTHTATSGMTYDILCTAN